MTTAKHPNDDMEAGRREFATLVHELGRLSGMAGTPAVDLHEGDLFIEVNMDDTRFLLGHKLSHPAMLSVRCPFGPIGMLDIQAGELLALNMELMDKGAVFGFEPQSGQVMYGFHVELEALTASELLDTLHDVATWREECARNGHIAVATPI